MKYDVGIVLAHELKEDFSLSNLSRERVESGVKLWKSRDVEYLVLTGEHKFKGEKYKKTIAEAMKEHSIKLGVDAKKVIKEEVDLETVGNLLFSKIGIIDPRGWKNLMIITHDYHGSRVKELAEFIFGDDYNLEYSLVNSGGLVDSSKSIEQFRGMVRGLKKGDSDRLLKRVLEKHGAYNKEPDYYRRRVEELRKSQENQ